MANEFLYKAVTNVGNLIYTAAREDTDGKPVTDVAFKTAQPVQLTGSNVPLLEKLSVTVAAGATMYLDTVDLSNVSKIYCSVRSEANHDYIINLERYGFPTGAASAGGRGQMISFSSNGSLISNSDSIDVTSPKVRPNIVNNDTVSHNYDFYLGGTK